MAVGLAEVDCGRYYLHDLLRLFAAERADANEAQQAVHRAMVYFVGTARAAAAAIYGHVRPLDATLSDQTVHIGAFASDAQATTWLESEWACVSALAQDNGRYAAQVLRTTAHYLISREDWGVVFRLATIAFQDRADDDLPSAAIADALLGQIDLRVGRFAEAARRFERALALWQRVGDLDGQATVWVGLAVLARRMGQPEQAVAHMHACLEALRRLGNHRLEAFALINLAEAFAEQGRHREAIRCVRRSLATAQQHPNSAHTRMMLGVLGRLHAADGNYRQALSCFDRALRSGGFSQLRDAVNSRLCRAETYVRLRRSDLALADVRWVQEQAPEADHYSRGAAMRIHAKADPPRAGHSRREAARLFRRHGPSYDHAVEAFLTSAPHVVAKAPDEVLHERHPPFPTVT